MRRTAALFLAALLGALVVLGLAVSSWGWPALTAYVVIVVTGLGLLVRTRRQPPTGTTCNCCTSTVYDPVEVR